VALHAIRKCFEKVAPNVEVIAFQDECYQLNPKLMVERDVDLFEQYWKKGRQIELENGMEAAIDTYHQAFAFYRGDFLEELPYQEWAERERDKFRETWLVILDRLSAHFFEKGRYQICLNLCKKILEKDECIEETHRRLMECYVRLGMREMAIRQYQKCKLSLSEELSVAPGKATCELYEKIREN
jgi:DNA-binding SARP family transcriptional activator